MFRCTSRYRRLFSAGGCELLVDLLGPWGAFTEPRRPSDALVVTRRHARPASVPTDALSASFIMPLRTREGCDETEPASRRTSVSPCRWGQDGLQPENTFRRIENLRAFTYRPNQHVLLIVSALPRTVSPSLGSCPASGGASSFLLASALALQQALRPPGGQDARCVWPTSATRMILRTPVPRAFPAHYATFTAWTPHGVLGSVRFTGGPSASRHSRTLRRITTGHALPCLLESPVSRRELPRAWVLSPHGARCWSSLWHPCRLFLFRGNSEAPSRYLRQL